MEVDKSEKIIIEDSEDLSAAPRTRSVIGVFFKIILNGIAVVIGTFI